MEMDQKWSNFFSLQTIFFDPYTEVLAKRPSEIRTPQETEDKGTND